MDARAPALFGLVRSLRHRYSVAIVDCNTDDFVAPVPLDFRLRGNDIGFAEDLPSKKVLAVVFESLAVENDAQTIGRVV